MDGLPGIGLGVGPDAGEGPEGVLGADIKPDGIDGGVAGEAGVEWGGVGRELFLFGLDGQP
jgi:hypothetical protein